MTEVHNRPILTEAVREELTRAIDPQFSSGIGYRTGTEGSSIADGVEYEVGEATGVFVGVSPDSDGGYIYVYIADIWAHKEAYDAPDEVHDFLRHESSFCHSLALELENIIEGVYEADVVSFGRIRDAADEEDSDKHGHSQYYVQSLPPDENEIVSVGEE